MARKRLISVALTAAALVTAAPAVADPDDLLPWCSGYQSPMDSACRVAPSQVLTDDGGVGTDPELPLGVDPGQNPVTGAG